MTYQTSGWIGGHSCLHSFPTRRSSDLSWPGRRHVSRLRRTFGAHIGRDRDIDGAHRRRGGRRSEEHTSELQSQSNIVCRLLLEKKIDDDISDLWYGTRPVLQLDPDPAG